MSRKPLYIVDESGERTHVLLPIEEYMRLLAAAENGGDAEDEKILGDSEDTLEFYRKDFKHLREDGHL